MNFDKVFTWQQYDEIVEKDGKDATNQAQEKANKMEKSLLKILSRHFLTTNFNSSRT